MSLYRSLYLWSKLQHATEIRQEIAPTRSHISGIQLLSEGEIGIHTNDRKKGIVHYDLNTLTPSREGSIPGLYIRYFENENYIILWEDTRELYVLHKDVSAHLLDKISLFPSIDLFILGDNTLYYVRYFHDKDYSDIYSCNLLSGKLESTLLVQINEYINWLGYTNGVLYLLTNCHSDEYFKIYTIDGTNTLQKLEVTPNLLIDLLHLNEYLWDNILSSPKWCKCLKLNPTKPKYRIQLMKVYGNLVFTGLLSGDFYIHYGPYTNNQFDVFYKKHNPNKRLYYGPYLNDSLDEFLNVCEPIKRYNFKDYGCYKQVEVVEGIDSHTVLICMSSRIVVLKFRHDFLGKGTGQEFQFDDDEQNDVQRDHDDGDVQSDHDVGDVQSDHDDCDVQSDNDDAQSDDDAQSGDDAQSDDNDYVQCEHEDVQNDVHFTKLRQTCGATYCDFSNYIKEKRQQFSNWSIALFFVVFFLSMYVHQHL